MNPFPGLRPFEADEDHLFFGREREIDELLRRLRATRFLSVVGSSGSGKSSLVRSGLIPSLQSGFMVGAGTGWRIATLRPGEAPIGHLAAALAAEDVLGTDPELAGTAPVLVEATLRRGSRGLCEAVRQARLPDGDNLLVLVDQFEELFRFRRSRAAGSRDEAIGFVKLLLEAAGDEGTPVYIVITMRSDFIGDCMAYPGLAEAVNDGQYLVPRMHRDALRRAITGPVAVAGGAITPRLVTRLLNDIGDDHDQLPVLQHALMRSWDQWAARGDAGAPMDVADYEDVGTLRQALSVHAEETYQATGSDRARAVAEGVFKALTDTFSDARGVRRPTAIADLAAICGATESEVIQVVEVFRQPGRSFLMPPARVPLGPTSIVDLSHESLMRCWDRLMAWADEERAAAAFFVRLRQAAHWHREGTAGLWRDPELELARLWREKGRPSEPWAARYDAGLAEALAFLDASLEARTADAEARARSRRRQLRQARVAALVFGLLALGTASLAFVAWSENARAGANLRLATAAVEETLSSADVDPARAGAEAPEMAAFRRELLDKARRFYVEFLKQNPRTFDLRAQMAYAHLRVGHIDRMLGDPDAARRDYERAIDQFAGLVRDRHAAGDTRALADAWNWLGETLRPLPEQSAAAASAYDRALALQSAELGRSPSDAALRQALARTHYNRGILRSRQALPGQPSFAAAEADFLEAVRLLADPGGPFNPMLAPDLARAQNNLGSLLASDPARGTAALAWYERAIGTAERLVAAEPGNRRHRLELAQFCNNAAEQLRAAGRLDGARERSARALDLLAGLARPAPALGVELADANDLRARILDAASAPAAGEAYARSLDLFEPLLDDPAAVRLPDFHVRFADLLLNLAARPRAAPEAPALRRRLVAALQAYLALGDRSLAGGAPGTAQRVVEGVAQVLPDLDEGERRAIVTSYERLRNRLGGRP